jgi:galactokinase
MTDYTKYTKNPYQIRYDVLAMAKDMMDKAYETNMTIAEKAIETYKDNAEEALKAWKNYVPVMYTPEEIKKNAESLYEFVMKNSEK